MTDWRPIETAPKDGTRFLAWPCWGGTTNRSVEKVWWSPHRKRWYYSSDMTESVVNEPTHWMPLPEPPQ